MSVNIFRKFKNYIVTHLSIERDYYNDYKEYKKWQYNNPNVKTKNALEAKILRQTHVLEKGMSLSHPREKFGVGKANELLDFIFEFEKEGYSIEESTPIINALGVISAYLDFHKKREFVPQIVIERFCYYEKYLSNPISSYGIEKLSVKELEEKRNSTFPEFFISRHSVRQFSDQKIKIEDINKVVKLAMHAPSACNRQSCKVYFYKDSNINKQLGALIAGTTGFKDEVKNYLVVTSDISAFYDGFERNQMYVDGGIFALALVEALHYYGIASCILQNGEFSKKNKEFKRICGNIPENEKIILFIAIGYYKDEFTYAMSHRKVLNEVLKIK